MSTSSPLSPAQPSYVFRGHGAQIHALHFLRDNSQVLSGDADGWVVLWNIFDRRPVVVWRPHQNAILGFDDRGDNIFTYVCHQYFHEIPQPFISASLLNL